MIPLGHHLQVPYSLEVDMPLNHPSLALDLPLFDLAYPFEAFVVSQNHLSEVHCH